MRYFTVVTLAVVLAGCATAAPTVDVSGLWSGSWGGYGVFAATRHDEAKMSLTQQQSGGYGRFWLDGTVASESVPLSMRLAGLKGVPVLLEVSGNRVVLRHQADERLLTAEFIVTGDRMIGRILDTELPGQIVLQRVAARTAVAPPPAPAPVIVAAAPPVPLAPPPAPAVTEPDPPAPPVERDSTGRPSPEQFSPVAALRPVYFEFDSADIDAAALQILEANARWLQTNREVLVLIEGHCDERGTDEYNLALGERRARSVRDHLVAQGVAAHRLTTLSYGENRPVCREPHEECWRQNRRAAFVVTGR